MTTFEVKVEIAQPPEVVEAAFMEPDNAVFWTTDLERFEVVKREPGEVGSIARLHFVQGGRRYIMEDVMLEYLPQRYFKSMVCGNGIEAIVETWLREMEPGTEVRIRWTGTAVNLRMRVLLVMMKGAMVRQTRSELYQFKRLVELHGEHFGP